MYNNPGEVREARNFKCKHCGGIFTTPQGINGHLVRKHDISATYIEWPYDWGTTTLRACENESMPVRYR